jgi:hypothetical protein
MRIRVTTFPQPAAPFGSLLPKELVKRANGNLIDLPWLFVGNVGSVNTDWMNYDPAQYVQAALKAPGDEILLDCELLHPYTRDGVPGRNSVSLGTWVYDRPGTIAAIDKWGAVVETVSKVRKVYDYPGFPLNLDVGLTPDLILPYGILSALWQRRVARFYAGGMFQAYAVKDVADWEATLDYQLGLCGMYGIAAKIALCSVFATGIQDKGPAASFLGADGVMRMCRAVRNRGLQAAFFNPNWPPALEAIARAAVEL